MMQSHNDSLPRQQPITVHYESGDLLNGLAQTFDIEQCSDTYERCVTLPSSVGTGRLRHLLVRPGLKLMLVDFALARPVRVKGDGHVPHVVEFEFWQAGYGAHYRSHAHERVIQPGEALLSAPTTVRDDEILYPTDESFRGVSLWIDPALLQGWFTDMALPDPLRRLLFDDPSGMTINPGRIPAHLNAALRQLAEAAWEGPMLRLYAEAKVMEIVALYVQYLTMQDQLPRVPLSTDDIERLHQAKAILLARIDDPPSLLELARAVCLNDHKLKAGFKAVFGTTVFGLLYDQRMEKARDLIESRRYSITEVAAQVGYASPSTFSAAFKRKCPVSKPLGHVDRLK